MKTLIFDFDGTLGDSFELAISIAYELTGMEPLPEAEMTRLRHLPMLKAIREIGIPLRRVPNLLLKGRQHMHDRMPEVHPFPGIVDVISSLHAAGNQLLIMSSNSEQNVRSFLAANGMEPYFEQVYGGVGIFSKASALKKILRHSRLQPNDCYYVGDEVRDVIAATKVGVHAVAVSWGYQASEALIAHQPFAVVDFPRELLRLFATERV
jgi:phosphoglycolate phosphatase